MANRYTDEFKKSVVDFVRDYNEKNGGGGQSAAKKEFAVNPISIKKWCVDAGGNNPSRHNKETCSACNDPESNVIGPDFDDYLSKYLEKHSDQFEKACRAILASDPPKWAAYGLFHIQWDGSWDVLPIALIWQDFPATRDGVVYPSPLTEVNTLPFNFEGETESGINIFLDWITRGWEAVEGPKKSPVPFFIQEYYSFSMYTIDTHQAFMPGDIKRILTG